MPDRLTTLEQATLALDTVRTPAVVGTVAAFDSGRSGIDHERLLALVGDRIRYVPRYRQRVLAIPGRLGDPVWVDDADFDLSFHVRRARLPRPGGRQQLSDFTARVLSRRMDRSRPLWELYLVDGLDDDRFALVAKTHPCLVDGVDTVDLLQVLLDNEPDDSIAPEESWHPIPAPGPVELLAGAVTESLRDPARTVSNLQHAVTDVLGAAASVGETIGLGDLAAETVHGGASRNRTPLTGPVSGHRRMATVSAALDDLRLVAAEHDHCLHDVLLELITGGLRSWLMTRGENVAAGATLTALTPVSVSADDDQSSLGSTVEPRLASLPIGPADASTRMDHIASETQAHKDSGRSIPARELADLAGFAPATLHDLGVRSSGDLVRRPYDVMITDVPGPRSQVYLGLNPMTSAYPVIPLSAGHLLAIGITSYNGRVLIGLNADRAAFGDLEVLAQCILDELADLLASSGVRVEQDDAAAASRSIRDAKLRARAAKRQVRANLRQAGRPKQRGGTSIGPTVPGPARRRRAATSRAEPSDRGYPKVSSRRDDQTDGSAQEGDR
jgi:diacylglycerol O-acyltransferase